MKFLDYIQGFRNGKEANAIEKESMTDPFLADAIDGYDSIEGNHLNNIVDMQVRLQNEDHLPSKAKRVWRILGAAVIFFIIAGGYLYLNNDISYTNGSSMISTSSKIYAEANNNKGEEQHDKTDGISSLFAQDSVLNDDEDNSSSKDQPIDVSSDSAAFSNTTEASKVSGDYSAKKSKNQDDNKIIRNTVSTSSEEETLSVEHSSDIHVMDVHEERLSEITPSSSPKKDDRKQEKNKTKITAKNKEKVEGKSESQKEAVSEKKIEIDFLVFASSKPLLGEKGFKFYLNKHIVYPSNTQCVSGGGIIKLLFNVSDKGRPVNITTEESFCDVLDKEIIGLLKSGPEWAPTDKKVALTILFVVKK